MHDYEALDTTGLTFRQNDIIEVLVQQPSGWWNGILGDQRGWFPSNQVSVIDGEEVKLPFCPADSDNGAEPVSSPSDHSVPGRQASDFHQKKDDSSTAVWPEPIEAVFVQGMSIFSLTKFH
jgi:hypothetical protein